MKITPQILNDPFAAPKPAPSVEEFTVNPTIPADAGDVVLPEFSDMEISAELAASLEAGLLIGGIMDTLPDRITPEDDTVMIQLMARLDNCSDAESTLVLKHDVAMKVRAAIDHTCEEMDDALSLLMIVDSLLVETLDHLAAALNPNATEAEKEAAAEWMSQWSAEDIGDVPA